MAFTEAGGKGPRAQKAGEAAVLTMKTIGQAVRSARYGREMEPVEVARAAGVILGTLRAVEEDRPAPTDDVARILDVFGLQLRVDRQRRG